MAEQNAECQYSSWWGNSCEQTKAKVMISLRTSSGTRDRRYPITGEWGWGIWGADKFIY